MTTTSNQSTNAYLLVERLCVALQPSIMLTQAAADGLEQAARHGAFANAVKHEHVRKQLEAELARSEIAAAALDRLIFTALCDLGAAHERVMCAIRGALELVDGGG